MPAHPSGCFPLMPPCAAQIDWLRVPQPALGRLVWEVKLLMFRTPSETSYFALALASSQSFLFRV